MITAREQYRTEFADGGLADAIMHVMDVRPHDQGALSLMCIGLNMLVGPDLESRRGANQTIQSMVTAAGALPRLINITMGRREMHQLNHEAFNFDTEAVYNV